MNLKKLSITLLLGTLLLTSCSLVSSIQTKTSQEDSSSSYIEERSSSQSENSSSTSQSEESKSSSGSKEEETKLFNFYCVNDFHGSILEKANATYYEAGIKKYFGELKRLKEKDPEHTIILSAGDMWQGSLESNYYYGKDVTEAMNEVPFDAMTLGNHEFDYGQQYIFENLELANFPFLAGNIVKWKNGPTEEKWDKRILSSTIIEKDETKIGIIGMIGDGQTTSIVSPNVEDITFTNAEKYAIQESKSLKKQGCSAVMLVIHAPNSTITGDSKNKGWSIRYKLKDYFDGIFTGHTHQIEEEQYSNVPLVQAGANGSAYSYIQLSIKGSEVECSDYKAVSSSKSWEEEASIASIYNKYINEESFIAKASEVAGTLNGGNLDKNGVARLGCKAIYDAYKEKYPSLVLSMENSQRSNLNKGRITYSDIYKATPFMNNIIIANVKGSDILNEAAYAQTYTEDIDNYSSLESNKFYTIAVIDYLYYHQDTNKNYNYFPSAKNQIIEIENTHPYQLTFDYIKNQKNSTINSSSFSANAKGFNLYK